MTDEISPEVSEHKESIVEQVKEELSKPSSKNYTTYAIIAAVVFFIISCFSGYSLKKQIDVTKSLTTERDSWKTKATSVVNTSEVDIPVKLGDTVAYEKHITTNANTSTESSGNNSLVNSTEHKKETTTVKSTVSAGLAISTKGNIGVPLGADIFYIGIGTIRGMALIAKEEQYGGAELNIYF